MRKTIVAGFIILFLIWWWLLRTAPAHAVSVCPRGYYLVAGPNSFGGNPRVCMPIGEANSEDAIPAVNYMPPLDYNVIQSL